MMDERMMNGLTTAVRFFLLRGLIIFTLISASGGSFVSIANAQHGPTSDHLLGSGAFGDIELLSVEEVTTTPGLVADVAVRPDGQWAFLANWGDATCPLNSEAGGQNNPDAAGWVS